MNAKPAAFWNVRLSMVANAVTLTVPTARAAWFRGVAKAAGVELIGDRPSGAERAFDVAETAVDALATEARRRAAKSSLSAVRFG